MRDDDANACALFALGNLVIGRRGRHVETLELGADIEHGDHLMGWLSNAGVPPRGKSSG